MNDPASAQPARTSSTVALGRPDGGVVVRDPIVFGSRLAELGLLFLERVCALPEVARVEIDGDRGEAVVVPRETVLPVAFLERLSQAIRGAARDSCTPVSVGSIGLDLMDGGRRVTVRRLGSTLTTWFVVHERSGRVRLRHPELAGDASSFERARLAVLHTMGVVRATTSKLTGSLLIEYDPAQTSVSRIVERLDRARRRVGLEVAPSEEKPPGFALANASLVLAAAGQTLAPALLPACAVLLVGSNLDTFRAAGRQLRRGQVGLPVLYTGIVAATLTSGQFVASAAMSWMLAFWRRAYRDSLATAKASLLGEILDQPRHARLASAADSEVETAIENLKPGDVVVVAPDETVPTDGRMIEGWGLFDERMVMGREGLSRKQAGDLVFAGSTLRAGQAWIEVSRLAAESRSAVLGRAVLAATTPSTSTHAPTAQGESFAHPTVAPTLAMAGVGLLLGDVAAAGAILRPDYATGVGLAHPLETLQAVALCARHGVLIRDAAAIERLSAVDLVILDHHPALERARLEVGLVRVFDGQSDDAVLAYALAAFQELGCDRATALRRACRARGIEPPRVLPCEYVPDIAFEHEGQRIKVGDLGSCEDRLMVGVNGRIAGLIHFQRTDRLEAAATIGRLRAKRGVAVGLVSSQPQIETARLTAALDLDFHAGGFSTSDRVDLLRACRDQGRQVAYVGAGRIDRRIVELAHVSFSYVGDDLALEDDPASIWLLGSYGAGLSEAWDVARIHQRRVRTARGQAVLPNLICVAGAFAWGFTSLASVVLTNLGTYTIYHRTQSSIRRLERQIDRSVHNRPFPARGAAPRPSVAKPTAPSLAAEPQP